MHYIITAVDAFDRQQMTVILLTVICYHILLTRGGKEAKVILPKGEGPQGGRKRGHWVRGVYGFR